MLGIPGIPAMPGIFMCAESGFDGIFIGVESVAAGGRASIFIPGMAEGFFFTLGRGLLAAFVVGFFFAAVDAAGLDPAAVFFFLAGAPICMFAGIFDFVLSRAVC